VIEHIRIEHLDIRASCCKSVQSASFKRRNIDWPIFAIIICNLSIHVAFPSFLWILFFNILLLHFSFHIFNSFDVVFCKKESWYYWEMHFWKDRRILTDFIRSRRCGTLFNKIGKIQFLWMISSLNYHGISSMK